MKGRIEENKIPNIVLLLVYIHISLPLSLSISFSSPSPTPLQNFTKEFYFKGVPSLVSSSILISIVPQASSSVSKWQVKGLKATVFH